MRIRTTKHVGKGVLVAGLMIATLFAVTSPAGAWGERYVTRPGCGTNFVSSYLSGGTTNVDTQNGTCTAGPVGVAVRNSAGANIKGPFWAGPPPSGISWAGSASGAAGGNHWGCNTCSVTTT